MSFLSNAHTHTYYCDGINSPAELLQAAEVLGFVSLGFTGHARQGFDAPYSMEGENQENYRQELRKIQADQRSRQNAVRIWVGLEQDDMTPAARKKENRRDYDYIIGSTHYLCRDFHGFPVAVDGNLEPLRAYVSDQYQGDMMVMVREYFRLHTALIAADKPDIIGHFDLIRKHALTQRLFDPKSVSYRRIALDALESIQNAHGLLEVNTGGIAKGYVEEPYPSYELLGAWREMGGRITLTSDCHNVELLDFGFDTTLSMLRSLGYLSLLRLGTGDTLWEEVEC